MNSASPVGLWSSFGAILDLSCQNWSKTKAILFMENRPTIGFLRIHYPLSLVCFSNKTSVVLHLLSVAWKNKRSLQCYNDCVSWSTWPQFNFQVRKNFYKMQECKLLRGLVNNRRKTSKFPQTLHNIFLYNSNLSDPVFT